MMDSKAIRDELIKGQYRRVAELQDALDRSTVEDLISYKLKGDGIRNLITLDDLRWQQIKVANQLRVLQDDKATHSTIYNVPAALPKYDAVIKEKPNPGEFSAVQQNRTLDKTN